MKQVKKQTQKRRAKSAPNSGLAFFIVYSLVAFVGLSIMLFITITTHTFYFKEYVGTINNPGVGYTTTVGYNAAPGNTQIKNPQGAVVLFFINIGKFSAGINAEGKDYDLDDTFFTALRGTFENCRNNGSTIAFRFRYDDSGVSNPEPKSFAQVLHHIDQIKQSGILEDYQDILMFVESGFVGQYGEQHHGLYASVEYKAKLLEAMLDCVPAPIPVTVRTPDIFAQYVGIPRSKLADYQAEPGSDAARVGLYNDGYMGSKNDLGTYANRAVETKWLGNQTFTSYFGGEFSGNIAFAKAEGQYTPDKCIPEMYQTHLSYINGNIYQMYKDYKFSKKYDVKGIDNSAYYGQTVYQFIRDHLGYRFVLQKSRFPRYVKQGGNLAFSFQVANNGFANPIKKQKCEIILENNGNFVTTQVDVDPTQWYSGQTITTKLNLKLPAFLSPGRWKVYFKSSIAADDFTQYGIRSIRFANKNVWNGDFGANYLGYVTITKSNQDLTDNTIGEVEKTLSAAHLYNLGNPVTVDGQAGDTEWADADIIAKNGKVKIYAKTDAENLYLMANLPHKAKSPVFNVRANVADGESYWLYVQPNGFVYFNHDGATGHAGLAMKYSANLVEFKIPLFMFNLQSGGVLTRVELLVQDSSISNWPRTNQISTQQNYTVTPDFTVFNVGEKLTLKKGSDYAVELLAEREIRAVVWYLDGQELAGQTSADLHLTNITQSGVLTARVTTTAGLTKTVQIAAIKVK